MNIKTPSLRLISFNVTTFIALSLSLAQPGIIDQDSAETAGQGLQSIALTVTVTNGRDELVTGLKQEDFSVIVDKVPQKISYFSSEDTPASVGILFDASESMSTRRDVAVLKAYKDALRTFFCPIASIERIFFDRLWFETGIACGLDVRWRCNSKRT